MVGCLGELIGGVVGNVDVCAFGDMFGGSDLKLNGWKGGFKMCESFNKVIEMHFWNYGVNNNDFKSKNLMTELDKILLYTN